MLLPPEGSTAPLRAFHPCLCLAFGCQKTSLGCRETIDKARERARRRPNPTKQPYLESCEWPPLLRCAGAGSSFFGRLHCPPPTELATPGARPRISQARLASSSGVSVPALRSHWMGRVWFSVSAPATEANPGFDGFVVVSRFSFASLLVRVSSVGSAR